MFLQSLIKRLPKSVCQEFHTATAELKQDKYVGRQATMLKKLMTGSNRSRKKFFTVDQTPAKQFAELNFLESSGSGKKRVVSGRAQRRVKVLNVLFVEQVTSMLSTGEVGAQVLELGLEITSVKVAPDFSRVNIYWQPTGTEKDTVFESILPRVGGLLRHELSQLRVIGIVPPIFFVKDPVQDRIAKVELALSKCDFGPDYEPTTMGEAVKRMKLVPVNPRANFSAGLASEIEMMSANKEASSSGIPLEATPEEIEEQRLKESEQDILSQSLEDILNGPEMRNDVLGLDHAVMMKKITHAVMNKAKTKSDSAQSSELASTVSEFPIPDVGPAGDEEDRTKEFLKYLEKRKRDRLKRLKLDSTLAAEKEFEDSEVFERWQQRQEKAFLQFDDGIEHPDDALDYIDDEDSHPHDDFKNHR